MALELAQDLTNLEVNGKWFQKKAIASARGTRHGPVWNACLFETFNSHKIMGRGKGIELVVFYGDKA
jgi:hypothetical protein